MRSITSRSTSVYHVAIHLIAWGVSTVWRANTEYYMRARSTVSLVHWANFLRSLMSVRALNAQVLINGLIHMVPAAYR